RPGRGPGGRRSELRVLRAAVRQAAARDLLTASAPPATNMSFSTADRVSSDPDRHQGGGTEPVDGHPRHVLQLCRQPSHPREVVTGLAGGLAASPHDVLDSGPIKLRHLVQHSVDDEPGHVVGALVDERAVRARPIGVRAVATMTASVMTWFLA